MIIKDKDLELFVDCPEEEISSEQTAIILLHGFTGSSQDWKEVSSKLSSQYYPVAIDILGHGQSSSPSELSFYEEESLIDQLDYVINHLGLGRVILLGYSMGGRLAISYATKHPHKVGTLILESSTPGIIDEQSRTERIKNDYVLAERIIKDGVSSFIDYWMEIPLFDSLKKLPKDKYQAVTSNKKDNNSIGLANSLNGFSTGKMKNHWNDLDLLPKKTMLISGESDQKYTAIAKQILERKPAFDHQIIKNTGHNSHLENPEEFFILVDGFLRTLK